MLTTLFLLFLFHSTLEGALAYKLRPPNSGCTVPGNTQLYFNNDTLINGCIQLSDILQSYLPSSSLYSSSYELYLYPGNYTLTETNINISYPLTIHSIISGTVLIQCSDASRPFKNRQIQFSNTSQVGLYGVVFEHCYSLRFDEMESVDISECTFRHFKSPSVDILNVLNIHINLTTFHNNTVTTINDRYRADGAGLSLSFNYDSPPFITPTLNRAHVNVTNCTFAHNSGMVPTQFFFVQISQVLNRQYYPARGGALGFIITEKFVNITASFHKVLFEHNVAESFGGAVYVGLDGGRTVHSISFTRNIFRNNICQRGGGGAMIIAYLKNRPKDQATVTLLQDSSFDDNFANSGGGILSLQTRVNGSHDYLIIRRCNFTRNRSTRGSAIGFGSLFNIQSQASVFPSLLEDCIFKDHTLQGATMIVAFTHIAFTGNNTFIGNRGPTLQIIGCLVQVKGNLSFVSNTDVISSGAAMHFSAFGQIKLFKTAHIYFINNTGTLGAAMRVDLQQFPFVYSQLLFNPLCFILYEEPNTPPAEWIEGMIHFVGNQAQLGSAIYVSYLDLCSYYTNDRTMLNNVFNIHQFPNWPIFEFGLNTNVYHSDSTNQSFYIQTPALSIDTNTFNNFTLKLRPSDEKTLRITGLDQFNNPTYFVARVLDENVSLRATLLSLFDVTSSFVPPANYSNLYTKENVTSALFNPSLLPVYPNKSSDVSYNIKLPQGQMYNSDNDNYIRTANEKTILIQIENRNGITSNYLNISLEVQPCLPGYQLQPSTDDTTLLACVCTGASADPFAVLECDDTNKIILLRNGYWAGFDGNGESGRPNLDVYTCPVTYCQCINDQDACITSYSPTNPNKQCHPPREGALCGSCGDNATVTILRLQCKENCQNNYYIYYGLVALIVGNVVIIILVLLASIQYSIPFPHSLRAILFYVQTVYVATEYFPITFWNARQYMLYLGSLVGMYFPVDFCFLSNASTVLLFLPRFIPPLLVFVIPIFFLGCKRGKLKIWHGVWSLIQVTYAPLCVTCMSLLHCPVLPDTNGENDVMRWYYDANIKCFSDTAHIISGVLAIIFLLGLILIIPFLIVIIVFENHSLFQDRYPFFLSIIEALKYGYLPTWSWWGGVELIKRISLIGIAIGLPGRTVAPVYLLTFFFILHIYVRPYKHTAHNIIEAIILLDYCLLFILRYPESLLESLASYHGTTIPNQYNTELPPNNGITIFYWPLFYLPVVFGIGISIVWVVHKIWVTYKNKSKQDSTDHHVCSDKPYAIGVDHYIDHTKINTVVTSTDIDDLVVINENELSESSKVI